MRTHPGNRRAHIGREKAEALGIDLQAEAAGEAGDRERMTETIGGHEGVRQCHIAPDEIETATIPGGP